MFEIENCLDDGQDSDVERLLTDMLASVIELGEDFDQLSVAFSSRGREALFLSLLIANPEHSLARPSIALKVVQLATRLSQEQMIIEWLYLQRIPDSLSAIWINEANIRRLPVSKLARRALSYLKYYSIPRVRTGRDLIEGAKKMAPLLEGSRQQSEYLYKFSSEPRMPLDEWRAHVTVAACIDLLLKEAIPRRIRARLVDKEAKAAAFQVLDPAKPALLFCFHGGFVSIVKELFHEQFSDGILVGQLKSKSQQISAKDDARAALFLGLRALQDGKSVILAPDGTEGTLNATVDVLGTTSQVGEGAAFLAYETECQSAWITVVRDDERFKPIIILAPSRQAGENYRSFKTRFLRFYGDQIADFISGDPRNLVLATRWHSVLRQLPSFSSQLTAAV